MPYAKHHKKEKERERSKRRNILRRKGYNLNSSHKGQKYNLNEKNPNWKGGITKLYVKARTSAEYFKWRFEVMKRDNFTCCFCHKVGGKLQVHHIKPFAQIIKENNIETFEQAKNCKELWEKDNVITLCLDCHRQTETYLKNTKKKEVK